VWDEEGPTPIENKSKVEITACSARGREAASSTTGELEPGSLEEGEGWRGRTEERRRGQE